jgi:acetyl-CoA synthetase
MSYSWQPTPEIIEHSNITAQMQRYNIPTYEEFLWRSCDDIDWFWKAFFDDVKFEWMHPYTQTVDMGDGMAWARWFVGGKLNWTYNALDVHVNRGDGEKIALRWEGEEGESRIYTYNQLLQEVNKFSNALLELGVNKGDRIGLWLPFIPEVAIGLLAIARIGAIAVPIFSGYGPEPAAVRLNDSEARFLITADGFFRKYKLIPLKNTVDEALKSVRTVEKVILVKRAGPDVPVNPKRDVWYDSIVVPQSTEYTPEPFDADMPCMLIYTSGTTGKPKGALHVHAGFPVKAAQDMFHVFDLKPSDTISWLTDIGWMMGPWLIGGGLILGATIFMYDGAPDHPAPDRLWQAVEKHNVSVLGVTPTLIRALIREGESWTDKHPMPTLRIIGSTGEPWNPDAWMWTLKNIGKNRAPIINYSGGTEVSGGILGCVNIRPLKPCSFNSTNPGMAAKCLNDAGTPVKNEIGYLAITNVSPGMTRGFWRDPERYEETYWSRWKDIWYHGDLVQVDDDGFWLILGRADDTLKIAGKRLGPSEIESVLAEHPAVVESAVIGVPDELKGQAAVAFVVLRPQYDSDGILQKELSSLVAERMGKSFAPKAILFVHDLPKTRNAKVMRRVVRSAYLGEKLGDISSLENPQSVEEIEKASVHA